ncbi:MAG TPA: hypothetical protein VND64_28925 [Pirellulales bacterium]|nr:hypothetical protein [Pirellulales bacterium]
MNSFVTPAMPAAIFMLSVTAWLSPSAKVYAVHPKVAFDLAYAVECRDVSQPDFAKLHPDEKLMEADLRVSIRIEQGDEQDLEGVIFEIGSLDHRLRIVDFLPHTQVQSGAGEAVEVVKTTENTQSLGAGMGASLSLQRADAHGNLNLLPTGTASTTHRKAITETTKRLPPGRVAVASGTIDNEHGVFFKWHASATTSFEGVKPLSFRFVVPKEWRGDWMLFSALARCQVKRHWFVKSIETCGQAKVFVALYERGDAEAQGVADELAKAQESYFSRENDAQRRGDVIAGLAATATSRQTTPEHVGSPNVRFKACKILFSYAEPKHEGATGHGPHRSESDNPQVALKHALERIASVANGQGCREE